MRGQSTMKNCCLQNNHMLVMEWNRLLFVVVDSWPGGSRLKKDVALLIRGCLMPGVSVSVRSIFSEKIRSIFLCESLTRFFISTGNFETTSSAHLVNFKCPILIISSPTVDFGRGSAVSYIDT